MDLEKEREIGLAFVSLKGKDNSYDQSNQEKAYWTTLDCRALIKNATTLNEIELACKIYSRYKWFL
jgi:hypothetical protein